MRFWLFAWKPEIVPEGVIISRMTVSSSVPLKKSVMRDWLALRLRLDAKAFRRTNLLCCFLPIMRGVVSYFPPERRYTVKVYFRA